MASSTTSANVIKLLPEYISNQIAAGEVVQRPSNIIKELVENSIDAKATSIDIRLSNGGKTYIEAVDNGVGISDLDARMAFERHATSKIKSIEDLFQIRTMGFRGEALASIAAVAQVQMITRTAAQESAVKLTIDQGKAFKQESAARDVGTTIIVKNLFFQVPARKHFLKSDQTELRHIVTEFTRIALSYPEVAFSLTHNKETVFQLGASNLKQRIVQLWGHSYEKELLPVSESMEGFSIEGFIGKPSIAKKTRDDCFFIVNKRFVKSPLIHKAIASAYSTLIAYDKHPFYVLHISLNPANVDINIHPNKQEIKFADEKWIFTLMQSQVKYALAKSNVSQPIQFDLDKNIQTLPIVQSAVHRQPIEKSSVTPSFSSPKQAHYIEKDWKKNIEQLIPHPSPPPASIAPLPALSPDARERLFVADKNYTLSQLLDSFLLLEQDGHFFLIDQQLTHERILYGVFLEKLKDAPQEAPPAQTLISPIVVTLSPTDMIRMEEHASSLEKIGFHIEQIGLQDIAIYAIPSHISAADIGNDFSFYIKQSYDFSGINEQRKEQVARSLAKAYCFKRNKKLNASEQEYIVRELSKTDNYTLSLDGKVAVKKIEIKDVSDWMNR